MYAGGVGGRGRSAAPVHSKVAPCQAVGEMTAWCEDSSVEQHRSRGERSEGVVRRSVRANSEPPVCRPLAGPTPPLGSQVARAGRLKFGPEERNSASTPSVLQTNHPSTYTTANDLTTPRSPSCLDSHERAGLRASTVGPAERGLQPAPRPVRSAAHRWLDAQSKVDGQGLTAAACIR